MQTISIGGFRQNIICILNIFRVLDEWLIGITDISGEDNLPLFSVLSKPHLDGRRS